MIFKLYLYLIFLYTFDRVLCNIRYFRISNYNVMKRMHHDFVYTFSNFQIAELQLDKKQLTRTMSVCTSVVFKGCARVPGFTRRHF